MIAVLMLYISVSVLTTLAVCSLRRLWVPELVAGNIMLGTVAAWIGGALFGDPMGPTYMSIPIAACFLIAAPAIAAFTAWATAGAEVTTTSEQPSNAPVVQIGERTEKPVQHAA